MHFCEVNRLNAIQIAGVRHSIQVHIWQLRQQLLVLVVSSFLLLVEDVELARRLIHVQDVLLLPQFVCDILHPFLPFVAILRLYVF